MPTSQERAMSDEGKQPYPVSREEFSNATDQITRLVVQGHAIRNAVAVLIHREAERSPEKNRAFQEISALLNDRVDLALSQNQNRSPVVFVMAEQIRLQQDWLIELAQYLSGIGPDPETNQT
jgi:hypothetical protein